MSFRIAIGRCDCTKPFKNDIQEWACGWIEEQLAEWRARLPGDISSFPKEAFDDQIIDGHRVSLLMHREPISDGAELIVLQVFVHTWNRPTFLSIGRVGRIYAEGLVVSRNGDLTPAPNEVMWDFR